MVAERKISGRYVCDLNLHTRGENEPDGPHRPTNRIDHSSKRFGIHRDGKYEDSVCSVRAAFRDLILLKPFAIDMPRGNSRTNNIAKQESSMSR